MSVKCEWVEKATLLAKQHLPVALHNEMAIICRARWTTGHRSIQTQRVWIPFFCFYMRKNGFHAISTTLLRLQSIYMVVANLRSINRSDFCCKCPEAALHNERKSIDACLRGKNVFGAHFRIFTAITWIRASSTPHLNAFIRRTNESRWRQLGNC